MWHRKTNRVSMSPHKHAGFDTADLALDMALQELADVSNYNKWQIRLVKPILGGRVLELGAGQGTFSRDLVKWCSTLVACEPSARAAKILRSRCADVPEIEVVEGSLSDVPRGAGFDASVMLNVLEHVESDIELLRDIREASTPNGRLAVFSPAFPILYSRFDHEVGHFRRYTKAGLRTSAEAAGCGSGRHSGQL